MAWLNISTIWRTAGFATICLCMMQWLPCAEATQAVSVIDFSPKGTHREIRQVLLRFSDNIVALGDDRVPDAAQILCRGTKEVPKGHWLDGKRWVAEFANRLPDGIACEVKPNLLKTLKGEAVAMPAAWRFDTGGPRLLRANVQTGSTSYAKENPMIALQVSAPLDPDSMRYLGCTVDGQVVQSSLLQGDERTQALAGILKQPWNKSFDANWLAMKCGKDVWHANAKIKVIWGKKLASAAGVPNTEEQQQSFQVRPVFSARFSCSHLWATPGCDPRENEQSLIASHLRLSENIPLAEAKQIALKGMSGKLYRPQLQDWMEQVSDLVFSPDLSAETTLNLILPDKLVDVDGRPLSNSAQLTATIGVAALPAYLGMPKQSSFLQWSPGREASWPVATRNLEKEVEVHAWHFTAASDINTLLHLFNQSNAQYDQPSWPMTIPFAMSHRYLADLGDKAPPMEALKIKPVDNVADFTPLQLHGYGTWLVEADSPAYRAVLDAQRRQLIKEDIIEDDTPKKLEVQITGEGIVLINGRGFTSDEQAVAELRMLSMLTAADRPRIMLQDDTNGHTKSSALVGTAIKRLGLKIVPYVESPQQFQAPPSLQQVGTRRTAGAPRPAGARARPIRTSPIISRWAETRFAILQLTNLHIDTLTSARGNSLIWVTAQDSGKPVQDAKVELWSPGDGLQNSLRFSGNTDAEGRLVLPRSVHLGNAMRSDTLVVRNGDDVFLTRPKIIYSDEQEPPVVHTILDRVLLHPGETVSMQHIGRQLSAAGMTIPDIAKDSKLRIFQGSYYGGTQPVFEEVINWSDRGSATTTWDIPVSAKLGAYAFQVVQANGTTIGSGGFQVEQFRTPLFEADASVANDWQEDKHKLLLQSAISYYSGGAAARQAVTWKGKYTYYTRSPRQYGAYSFFPPLPQGTADPAFVDISGTLDDAGHGVLAVNAPDSKWPLLLQSEMSFADPNGETQSRGNVFVVWPKPRKVGLHISSVGGYAPANADVVELDDADLPLKRQDIEVNLIDPQGKSTRACLITTDDEGKGHCVLLGKSGVQLKGWRAEAHAEGAADIALDITESIDKNRNTNGDKTTDSALLELADPMPPQIGSALRLKVRAPYLPASVLVSIEREGVLSSVVRELHDEEEIVSIPTGAADAPSVLVRALFSHSLGAKDVPHRDVPQMTAGTTMPVLFAASSSRIKLELQPERKTVLPGEHVALAIKGIFASDGKPAAHARVTIVAVDDGLANLKLNNTWNLLQALWAQQGTDASHDSSDLDWLTGHLLHDGKAYVSPLELALQFDHGIVDISDEEWSRFIERNADNAPDMLMEMRAMQASAIASTGPGAPPALSPLKGKLFELTKSPVESGVTDGDVLRAPKPRTNFSTLALWQTDVELNEQGEASVSVPMPDSLTRWRIAAIAAAGADRFGTDETTVQTSQPVQILSGLPPTVRSDDVLMQKLTVRNTTDQAIRVLLSGEATGERDDSIPGTRDPMPAQAMEPRGLTLRRELRLAPGQNQVVAWQMSVPDGVVGLNWAIAVHDDRGRQLDALVARQDVVAPVPVTVREASLVALDHAQTISIAQPSGAIPAKGGVRVKWSNSLVEAAMDGARRWMARYPYSCMEQLGSRALVSGDAALWQSYLNKLPAMIAEDGLVRYFPEIAGSEALTVYLLDIADAYRLAIPAEDRARMVTGLRTVYRDRIYRDRIPAQKEDEDALSWLGDNGYYARLLALQAAIAPDLGDAAPTIPKDLHALPTNALVDWTRYVLALTESPERTQRLDAASSELRDRFDMQGTRLTLRVDPRDSWWWFMWNGEVAAARATLLVQRHLQNEARWQDLVPGMIGSLTDMQREGHWRTTVANAWAGAALMEFAGKAERGPVDGSSIAAFGGNESHVAWPGPTPAQSLLPWPQQGARADLTLRHEGNGTPWATVQVSAAVATDKPISHGVSVERKVEPVQQKVKGRWSVGDILRVTLTMKSDADLSWVAVRDPIPSGATIMGKGLKGESTSSAPDYWQWWWYPSSAELGSESYRGYYQHIWRGNWMTVYQVRLNNAGDFKLPPTRVEAMYAPEIFGEQPNAPMTVEP